jgi:small nuclear ribonucleoprotein (snRNP)-like protein
MTAHVFQTMFKSLVGKKVIVEVAGGLVIKGVLQHSNDHLNFFLVEVEVLNAASFPQFSRISQVFIRGSAVNVVHLPPEDVDLAQLRSLSSAAATK